MSKENNERISRCIFVFRLRSLVLALGECTEPVWWKTRFMSETGLRFLRRLYPRTELQAAVHAAGTAACKVHDGAVGRVGVYHLFRLPESVETEMYVCPSFEDKAFVEPFRSSLGNPERLLPMLSDLCDVAKPAAFRPGPVRIGTVSDADTIKALAGAASAYHEAFIHGKPAFPYFAEN